MMDVQISDHSTYKKLSVFDDDGEVTKTIVMVGAAEDEAQTKKDDLLNE